MYIINTYARKRFSIYNLMYIRLYNNNNNYYFYIITAIE